MIYPLVIILLLSVEHVSISSGQGKPSRKTFAPSVAIKAKAKTASLQVTESSNMDTIRNLLKSIGHKASGVKKISTVYKYRTRIKTIRDTVYIERPDSYYDYISEENIDSLNCPPDTVYVDRPILIKKKSGLGNLLRKIF